MKIREVMTDVVVTASPDTAYKEVVDQLVRSHVSGLPVIDDAGELVGIVTEADLLP